MYKNYSTRKYRITTKIIPRMYDNMSTISIKFDGSKYFPWLAENIFSIYCGDHGSGILYHCTACIPGVATPVMSYLSVGERPHYLPMWLDCLGSALLVILIFMSNVRDMGQIFSESL